MEPVLTSMLLVAQIWQFFFCVWTFISTTSIPIPECDDNNDPQELYNLLAPPSHVLRLWPHVFWCFYFSVVVDPWTTSGNFFERYTGGTNERLFLYSAVVSCISVLIWEIFKLLNGRYLDIIAFCGMWCGLLPIYCILNQKLSSNTLRDKVIFFVGEVSVRLYFTWLTGALIFGILDVAQYIHGRIFSFDVYFQVMVMMLTLAFVTYGRTRDPIVALLAMWFLGQIINIAGSFEGDAKVKETFEKLLEVAKVMMPAFPLVMAFDIVLNCIAKSREEASLPVVGFRSEEGHTRYGTT